MLFIRKLKHMRQLYEKSLITFEELNASVQSWLGHAKHADSYGLRKKALQASADCLVFLYMLFAEKILL
jgi:hypothetical protein